MALKSTVYKLELGVADVDRGYYDTHSLTVARHPSETDLRMMVQIVVFALNAHERLSFGRGLSDDDEPALAQTSLSGEFEHWIDVGHPSERRIRKACGQAERVSVFTYADRASAIWWSETEAAVARHRHLTVVDLAVEGIDTLVSRSMALQCTVDGASAWLTTDDASVEVRRTTLKPPD